MVDKLLLIQRGIWTGSGAESVLTYLCSRSSSPCGKHSDVNASLKQV